MLNASLVAQGMAQAMEDGAAVVPYAFLRTYRLLKLNDTEGMLVLHLLAYRQLEQNDFPTMEQLQERLGASSSVVGQSVKKLMELGLLSIDEVIDPITGVQSEKYNLSGLYMRIGELLATGVVPVSTGGDTENSSPVHREVQPASKSAQANVPLYQQFEQEFGRPLTPLEIDSINGWLDQDRYSEDLIRLALKESVFSGKVHLRYIDRILLEWSRNRVTNAEDARRYAQQYRGGR